MTAIDSLDLVHFIIAAYPAQRQKLSKDDIKAMVAAYHAGLEDLELATVKQAATRLIRTSKFMPSVAEIREAVGVVHDGARRHGVDAWGDVLKLTRRDRNLDDLEGVDPLVYRICQQMDWIVFRDLWSGGATIKQWRVSFGESENVAADRARFIEAYDKLTVDARREAQASPGATLPAAPAARAELDGLASDLAAKLTSGKR